MVPGLEVPYISQYLSNTSVSQFRLNSTANGSSWKNYSNWIPGSTNVYLEGSWELTTDRFMRRANPSQSIYKNESIFYSHYLTLNTVGDNVSTIRYDIDGYLINSGFGLYCGLQTSESYVPFGSGALFFDTRTKVLKLVSWNGANSGVINYMDNFYNVFTLSVSPAITNFNMNRRNLYSLLVKICKGSIESVEVTLMINNKILFTLDECADSAFSFSTATHAMITDCAYNVAAEYKLKSVNLIGG